MANNRQRSRPRPRSYIAPVRTRQHRVCQHRARQHCSRTHRLNVKKAGVVLRVTLQALFLQNPRYFIVTVPEVDPRRLPEQPAESSTPNAPNAPNAPVDVAFTLLRQQLGQTRQYCQR